MLHSKQDRSRKNQPDRTPTHQTILERYLLHLKLSVRFPTLLAVVLVIFLGVWVCSYYFLPEGLLRGRSVAQALAGDDLAGGSVWWEWLRILAVNLGVMFLLIIGPNLLQSESGFPLGYSTVTLIAAIFGVYLGTNSFTISAGGKMLPTLMLLESSGLYEITAYVLAAAATSFIARYRLVGKWPKQTVERIDPPGTTALVRERYAGVLGALVLLLLATAWEAYRIAQAIR
jgi:hypothetical protein